MKRPLWQTLAEVAAAVRPPDTDLVSVTSVWLDLPIQVSVAWRPTAAGEDPLAGLELLADVPAWRWTTPFDERIGRLQVSLQGEPDHCGAGSEAVPLPPAQLERAAGTAAPQPDLTRPASPHPEADHGPS